MQANGTMNGHVGGRLLGPTGRPINGDELRADPREAVFLRSLFGRMDDYLRSLSSVEMPAMVRARDPIAHHAWVYAAAMLTATTSGSAPLVPFRETEDELERRALLAKRAGRQFVPSRGIRRRAMQRHDITRGGGTVRHERKGIEPDWEHPIAELLLHPNEMLDGWQLQQLTDLFLVVRGEVFWVFTAEDGGPPGDMPERIWPISPDCFEPVLEHGTYGGLAGWDFTPPKWVPDPGVRRTRVRLPLTDVVQFKFPNPGNPLRGLSPLAAAATAVETDLMIATQNRALLKNGSTPRGALVFEGDPPPEEERRRILEKWKDLHEGPENAARLAALYGGFKWQQLGLNPSDMEYPALRQADREEVLGVLFTPPSMVGLTEFTNYATALGQKRNFWENRILPLFKLKEAAIDGSLMRLESDDVFIGHDLSGVDALRVGIGDKLSDAAKACTDALHMPPRVAYQVVGLEVPKYEGDDVALVGALATPLRDALDPDDDFGAPAGPPAPLPEDDDDEPTTPADSEEDPDDPDEPEAASIGSPHGKLRRRRKSAALWRAYQRVQGKAERRFRGSYRRWVREHREATLVRFDAAASSSTRSRWPVAKTIDLTVILPTPEALRSSLRDGTRPIYVGAYSASWEFTLGEIGVPVFEFDDPRFIAFFNRHEQRFLGTTPETMLKNLQRSLQEGIVNGETIQQLRVRVGEAFNLAASSPKTLAVARTTTASFMNGVRAEMFRAQGFEKKGWSSANDEATRPPHKAFDAAGLKPIDFDWLQVWRDAGHSESGRLLTPGDLDAPIGQIANCRCLEITD